MKLPLYLAASAVAVMAAEPAWAQQRYVCTTVTVTTTEYLSNGTIIIDRRSYSVCYPLIE